MDTKKCPPHVDHVDMGTCGVCKCVFIVLFVLLFAKMVTWLT